MFFDTNKAQLKEVRVDVKRCGPVKAFAFKMYCSLFVAAILYSSYIFSLGLSEPLEWALLSAFMPVSVMYGLWEFNAVQSNSLWPKVWYIRNKQIWPRQK